MQQDESLPSPHSPRIVTSLQPQNNFLQEVEIEQEQQTELEMLTEECQDLINKIFSNSIQVQDSFLSEHPQETNLKQDKSRLEREFLDLCIEIQRQQKELESYKFKIKVANKQAEYYTRQIKEKQEILKNLQRHHEEHSSRRKSFGRK